MEISFKIGQVQTGYLRTCCEEKKKRNNVFTLTIDYVPSFQNISSTFIVTSLLFILAR